ncbi:hypothetical protein M758_4G065100 [Ceratodon purpureus]|uniref:AP2/ERF domain-containing protein n=1 Tax=Ceratodon purpureus TaxID=3225 RepID=A0A8T0I984_CERPU|nr:hypothetical protein KC19_4G067500 [Ceratodon purpureus]KAG0618458.1 hypothetical protein M758_4G065100 [Ceratodon purpureus]
MPEVGDLHLHAHGVDGLLLQRSSNQGCFSRCYSCLSGVKSELFNACLDCRELLQDVKPGNAKAPLLVDSPFWGAPDEIPQAPVPTITEDHPFAPSRLTRPRSSSSDDSSRDHLGHARLQPLRSPTSPYRTLHSQRGRPPNGSRQGPPGFKGVRQRKGVRGFLVEIRPPRWKRTIWLGTYNTDREAAGAYDAGIFYTHKKTKYNFPDLEGTFPPLPSQLRLDNADDSEEIKTFVQKEARLAAQKVKAQPLPEIAATSIVTTPNGPTVGAMSTSSEECSEVRETETNTGLAMPPADEEWFNDWSRNYHESIQAHSLFDDLLGHGGFQHVNQQIPGWSGFPKQEEITLSDDGLL